VRLLWSENTTQRVSPGYRSAGVPEQLAAGYAPEGVVYMVLAIEKFDPEVSK
jgi:hypothetical protein